MDHKLQAKPIKATVVVLEVYAGKTRTALSVETDQGCIDLFLSPAAVQTLIEQLHSTSEGLEAGRA